MSFDDMEIAVDPDILIPGLFQRVNASRQLRKELNGQLMETEIELGEFFGSIDVVTARIKNRVQELHMTPPVAPPQMTAAPASAPASVPPLAAPAQATGTAGMTLEEFKANMASILQGSLDAVSDKLSSKIAGMLKELPTLSGSAREYKLREIQEAAGFESVDFSSLYKHEQVTSNIADIGVEEKESKGIDSTLEKLRKLKGLKSKPPGDQA